MKYKTIVLDLDGTLTNSKKELSVRNREALIELQRRGVTVVLASGRPTYGIVPLARELRLEEFGGYILSFNGGVITECATGREIYSNVLPDDLITPLYIESKSFGCTILSYDAEIIITEQAKNQYVEHEAFLNKMEVREVDSFISYFNVPLPKCLAVGDPQKVIELEKHLISLYGDQMSIYRSEPFFLELVPLGIDKAYSLAKLMEHTGGTKEEMIAFGDGYNDLSMIEYAGCGVAMDNAQEEVKKAANDTTLSNDLDGVAHYLTSLYSL